MGKAGDKRSGTPEIKPSDLSGLKDLRGLAKLLEVLRDIGCERDKADNRKLRMNHYCLLLAMWLHNPIVDALRGLQQASTLDKVHKRLGVGRASLGSLSESARIFDPEPLAAIAQELGDKIPDRTPENFKNVNKKITAVDGSVFKILAQVASLAWLPQGEGKSSCGFRLHAQFEVFRGVPNRIDMTSAKPKGKADERAVLENSLESQRCYLLDRGYQKHVLWNAINAKGSDYICRVNDKLVYEVVSENELSAEAKSKNVISDQIVRLGTANSRTTPPDHRVRLVVVKRLIHTTRAARRTPPVVLTVTATCES